MPKEYTLRELRRWQQREERRKQMKLDKKYQLKQLEAKYTFDHLDPSPETILEEIITKIEVDERDYFMQEIPRHGATFGYYFADWIQKRLKERLSKDVTVQSYWEGLRIDYPANRCRCSRKGCINGSRSLFGFILACLIVLVPGISYALVMRNAIYH
jgi:hypothetical protein